MVKKPSLANTEYEGKEDYSEEGRLEVLERGNSKTVYLYNDAGYVTEKSIYIRNNNGKDSFQTNRFKYNSDNQIILQSTPSADITYSYHEDGRIKSKSYSNNDRSRTITIEPKTIHFIYNSQKNLIYVGSDTSEIKVNYQYNDENKLIRHDYSPGSAYNTFKYDDQGRCSEQITYELKGNDWDSTVFLFEYNERDQIVSKQRKTKKGEAILEKEWVYDNKGNLIDEKFYEKEKCKYAYHYLYEYYHD